MGTLSSQPTNFHPRLPSFSTDFAVNLSNGQRSMWKHKGFSEGSVPFPLCYLVPLPCKSLQSKHSIAPRRNTKKGQSFDTIVRSCISRAVGFPTRQFKMILKSFSDSSARKTSSFVDVRGLVMEAMRLMEQVIFTMMQGLLIPFRLMQFGLYISSAEFENQVIQLMVAILVLGAIVAGVLLWLIWRWWRRSRGQGLGGDGHSEKREDEDTAKSSVLN